MNIRCVALDIDGTVIGKDAVLSLENKEAIMEAIDRGIAVVPASGRAYYSLPPSITEISGISYVITSNGAAIYHLPTRKCVCEYNMEPDAVERVLELTQSDDIVYEVFIKGRPYAYGPYVRDPIAFGRSSHAVSYIQSTRTPVENMGEFILEHKGELNSIALIHRGEDTVSPIREKLTGQVNGIYITSSLPRLTEIADERAGKKEGLAFVLRLLNIGAEETAAFGNGDNDWEMLHYVGFGVAVADATPLCRQAADYITKPCEENGVAETLWDIFANIY